MLIGVKFCTLINTHSEIIAPVFNHHTSYMFAISIAQRDAA